MKQFLFGVGLCVLGALCLLRGASGQMPGTFTNIVGVSGGLACTPNTDGGGNDGNVIGLWHFDNNGTDKSQGNHNLTLNGGATFSNVQSKFGGYAYKGAATNSSASIATGTGIYSGITDFTVEYWLYLTAAMGGATWFIADGTTGSVSTTFSIDYSYQNASKTEINAPTTTVVAVAPTSSTLVPTLNAWHHWAWVRQGSIYRFYYDGVAQPTSSSGAPSIGNGSAAWTIANYANGGGSWLKEYMDEFRFSNVARYTANFTPQTLAFCDPAVVPPPPGHAWNPADARPTYTILSNNNYDVVSSADSQTAGVRATKGLSAGKFYFEIKALTAPGYTTFGISNSTYDLTNTYVGQGAGSAGIRPDGVLAFSASSFGTISNPFTASSGLINDVYGFAVDMDNKRMWVSRNNTWYGTGSPNPATGTAPNLTAIPAVAVFPVINAFWTGAQDKWRLQDGLGQPFTYTPPIGFTAYGSM
jgi:Concanavalin A-like lectin/glucanases superfamily